ncbi:MAG: hypothetical protein ABI347_06340 [Nitrososphaera sp.]|jgi:hypothetical protein
MSYITNRTSIVALAVVIVATSIIIGIILIAQVQANRFSPAQIERWAPLNEGARQVINGNPVVVLKEGEGTGCIQLVYIDQTSNFTQIYLYSGFDASGKLAYSSHIVGVGESTGGMGNLVDARL